MDRVVLDAYNECDLPSISPDSSSLLFVFTLLHASRTGFSLRSKVRRFRCARISMSTAFRSSASWRPVALVTITGGGASETTTPLHSGACDVTPKRAEFGAPGYDVGGGRAGLGEARPD